MKSKQHPTNNIKPHQTKGQLNAAQLDSNARTNEQKGCASSGCYQKWPILVKSLIQTFPPICFLIVATLAPWWFPREKNWVFPLCPASSAVWALIPWHKLWPQQQVAAWVEQEWVAAMKSNIQYLTIETIKHWIQDATVFEEMSFEPWPPTKKTSKKKLDDFHSTSPYSRSPCPGWCCGWCQSKPQTFWMCASPWRPCPNENLDEKGKQLQKLNVSNLFMIIYTQMSILILAKKAMSHMPMCCVYSH